MPNNVKVVDDFSYIFKNKIKRSVVTAFSITLYKAIFSHLKFIKSVSDLKLIIKYVSSYLTYYDFFSNLEEIDSAAIIYTYWFNEAPLAFSEIKKQKEKNFKVISRAHRYDIYEGLESTLPFWVYRQKTIEQTDCIYSISLKRIGFILDSVVAFAKTVPYRKIVWTHFGDGDELLTLKKKAQAITPENMVVNFKGNVENSQIYEHYATESTDLFINLSSSEGIPVSIMEAQSFGIPVIATNVGGSCEIVVTQTGILLSENPIIEDVVNALSSILIEKSINNMKVKEYWKDNFDADRNYSEFSKAISKLI